MKKLTTKQYEDFSMNGRVEILLASEHDDRHEDSIHEDSGVYVIRDENIDLMVDSIKGKKKMDLSEDGMLGSSYPYIDNYFQGILDNLIVNKKVEEKRYDLKDKNILITGTSNGWYEAWVLAHGGIPYVLELKDIDYDGNKIHYIDVNEAKKLSNNGDLKFDYCISFSTFEHSGLGRYGDKIEADGDLKAMMEIFDLLADGGILFLSVPIGFDRVVYPLHRIYGKARIPHLFNKWTLKGMNGCWWMDFLQDFGVGHQPIFILQKDIRYPYDVDFYNDMLRFGMVAHTTNILDLY